jgi:hypothetical protein
VLADGWTAVTSGAPKIIGNQWQVTVPVASDAQFFRLQR